MAKKIRTGVYGKRKVVKSKKKVTANKLKKDAKTFYASQVKYWQAKGYSLRMAKKQAKEQLIWAFDL